MPEAAGTPRQTLKTSGETGMAVRPDPQTTEIPQAIALGNAYVSFCSAGTISRVTSRITWYWRSSRGQGSWKSVKPAAR